MKLELNDKDVAMLMGILSKTNGNGFIDIFNELFTYAEKNNPDIIEVAKLISTEYSKYIKFNIDEDEIYDDAIIEWNFGGKLPW